MGYSTGELVALHLWEQEPTDPSDDPAPGDGPAPYAVSIPGISDTLGLDDTLSDRVQLLSTLDSMKEEGLLVEDRDSAEGLPGERNVYRPTDEGRHLARDVYDRLEGDSIDVVDNGDTTTVPLEAVDDELPDVTLAGALARTSDDGVLHLRDDRPPTEGIVDRRAELDTVRSCIEAVTAGATETLLVAGESGIGKTTLVDHVLDVAAEQGFEVLTGTAQTESTEPYLPIREALADHSETPPALLFDADSADRHTNGADLEDLADRRQSLFFDVGEALADLAADRPLALFLDDLHAADPGTLALLEYLATAPEAPVLSIGAYRPEELYADHPLTRLLDDLDEEIVRVELGPMDQPATRTLIERTLDDRGIPQSFADAVHTRTGGHPLFVEATVSQLREQGVVDPRTGHYPADPDIPLPQQVRSAIEHRLDALDDIARTVIETASVVGTTVDFRVLATVTDLAEADLRDYVDLLVATHVWTRDVDGAGEAADDDAGEDASDDVAADGGRLAFANEVVRNAVREQLPDRQRRVLHEQVAEAFEAVHEAELDAHAGTIAHHYEQAGALEQAIEYYRRAGDHAASVYAHETAVDNYERALALAREHDRDETVLELLQLVGMVYLNADDYQEANRCFEYVLERTDDPTTRWEVTDHRVQLRNKRGEFDAAVEVADSVLDEWDGETATPEVRALLGRKVWALSRTGELERARALAETQMELAEALDDPGERSDALIVVAAIEKASGNLETAIELLEDAIEAARAAGDKSDEATSRNNLGVIYWGRDVETALEMFEDCVRLYREMNSLWGETVALSNVGSCLEQLGEWDRALARFEDALERSRKLDADHHVASDMVGMGNVFLKRGELASARTSLDRGLELADSLEYRRSVETAHVALARLEHYQGNVGAGETHADAVIQHDEPAEARTVPDAYAAKGRLRLAQGDLEGALSAHERGRERAAAIERPRGRVRNQCGLADVHRRAGRLEAAREQAEEAREAAAERSDPLLSIEAALALERVQRAVEPDRAEETLRTALENARDLGAAVHECEALYELGMLHRDHGDPASAHDALEDALALAKETGATLFVRRCEGALERLAGAGDS